jgi:pyruvate dehydrogenase E2 component (dihydrolipoamide acetyltransferase)
MATKVVMPKLSPTMEEGQIGRWLKKEGDKVSSGEPIAEIETDKASMEMQALATGTLRKILLNEGDTAPLGQVIAIIGEADEDISKLVGEAESPQTTAENKKSIQESVQASGHGGAQQELARVIPDGARTQATIKGEPIRGEVGGEPTAKPSGNGASTGTVQEKSGRLIVSPIAARMAADAGINLQSLQGSGPGGRIIKRDIEEAMRTRDTGKQAEVTVSQSIQQPAVAGASTYRDVPTTEIRRTIARRLVTSIGPVPHFFLTIEVEMDQAMEMRRSLNSIDPELKISPNDLIIKVAAVALKQHPAVNASFQDKTIRYYDHADIGVAVAIDDGLITPVIRAADQKSVGTIAREVKEMAERARAKKLKPEEYTGATFSISNLGMFGIEQFTAVINPPEAAILAVGAIQQKPVVRDGQIVVRQIMNVTMSCDHRVIDGATGAKYLQTFKKILETPLLLIA